MSPNNISEKTNTEHSLIDPILISTTEPIFLTNQQSRSSNNWCVLYYIINDVANHVGGR